MEKITIDKIVIFKITITTIGNEIPAISELSDTYFVITRTSTKIKKQINIDKGLRARTIPTNVETPLPPRNLAYTGKICPSVAATPRIS